MTASKMTLKEMCEAYDVTPRTLRYYEYIELLIPEKQGRKRFYGNKEKARLKLIKRGRRFGFTLEEIRQWLLIYEAEGTAPQYREFVRLADRQLEVLDAELVTLKKTIEDLRRARADVLKSLD